MKMSLRLIFDVESPSERGHHRYTPKHAAESPRLGPRCQVKERTMTNNIDINSRCLSLPNPRRVKAVRCHNEVQQYQL